MAMAQASGIRPPGSVNRPRELQDPLNFYFYHPLSRRLARLLVPTPVSLVRNTSRPVPTCDSSVRATTPISSVRTLIEATPVPVPLTAWVGPAMARAGSSTSYSSPGR